MKAFVFLSSLLLATSLQAQEGPSKLQEVEKIEDSNIERHRDIYILWGKPDTKVQLSFKLKPLLSQNFYLAYTQQMFWEFDKNSSPFKDINYNPEAFYDLTIKQNHVKQLRLAVEHRSNGKEKEESRSIDRVYGEVTSEWGFGWYTFLWDLKLYYIYDIDWRYNRDIRNYAGFWSTQFRLNGLIEEYLPAKGEMYLSFYPGGRDSQSIGNGAMEFGLRYRVRLFGFMPYLMAQYYYGYMESLASYNNRVHSYRVGFML